MGRKEKNRNFDTPDKLNRLVDGVNLKGDISLESSFRLDGKIVGNIDCQGKFVLGETGLINGDLECLEAEIEGKIEGDLKVSDLLVLRSTAIIVGVISTARIVIEDGAQIGGQIKTTNLKTESKKSESEADIVY